MANSQLKLQIGKSTSADFSKKTWSFRVENGLEVSAGQFAIIPLDKFDELIESVKSMMLSMNVHPDCEERSEFADMVSICDNALKSVL